MDLENLQIKADRLEKILEFDRTDKTKQALALCEIWMDKLWECCGDSFEEFLRDEFETTELEAFMAMKLEAMSNIFPDDIAEAIDQELERLER
jgi:hypothetical protein